MVIPPNLWTIFKESDVASFANSKKWAGEKFFHPKEPAAICSLLYCA